MYQASGRPQAMYVLISIDRTRLGAYVVQDVLLSFKVVTGRSGRLIGFYQAALRSSVSHFHRCRSNTCALNGCFSVISAKQVQSPTSYGSIIFRPIAFFTPINFFDN